MTRLDELPINKKVITHLKNLGIIDLFPPQEEAFNTGVLEGKNLVLAIPTSSGKTLVAEVCMLKAILDGRGKALYLVPLKSLAREKYNDFKKYESLGITVAMSVGDYDSPGTKMREADILILTTERADSLVRHKSDWIEEIGIIIVDEIHLVNDSTRGPTLEMVLAKLMQMAKAQIVALSATISNADEIASWLEADLVKSTWRPVPLSEGVYLDGEIDFFEDSLFEKRSVRFVPRKRKEELADIVCDTLDENGQVLLFVSSRKSTVSMAKRLVSSIRQYLTNESISRLLGIAKKIGNTPSTPEASRLLSKLVADGIAFHHAGLDNKERMLVEDAFKDNLLKVVVATPTLAAGVNLPARRVIIRDYRRFDQNRGSYPIPILEYKQMAGRAGRPKYDKYGEAVLFARTESEKDALIDHYTLSDPEEIYSRLASPAALQFHLLASIAAELTNTSNEIDGLISNTFYACQNEQSTIAHHILSALSFLENGKLIEIASSSRYSATPLGKRASQLYIDPQTAILFRDALSQYEDHTLFGILHLICHSPDQPVTYVSRSETEEYEILVDDYAKELMIEQPDIGDEKYSEFLGEVKTARILSDWISEATEKDITESYNVGMGDVHRFVQSAEWLVYSASEIARITNNPKHIPSLKSINSRLKYGVREDILELVNLRGIGRVRGRMLYNQGLKTLVDLYNIPLNELARIPTIGTSIAESIKKQLGVKVKSSDTTHSSIIDESEEDFDSIQTLLDDFT
ncbi:MAG: DEAD/DEAH box helicase [Candidatus Thorarchaeota archaeon]|nr:DEAD/DEAH box helicase [Candidatus Thorarchaeota archaeon]